MTPAGQWYYLSGADPVGPITQSKLFDLVRGGQILNTVQIAAAGWQQWQPASAVFPELLAPATQVVTPAPAIATGAMPAAAPAMTPSPTPTVAQTQQQPAALRSQVQPSFQPQAQPQPQPVQFQPQPQPQSQPVQFQPQPQPQFAPQSQPVAFVAPAPTAIPAVQLRCIAGPDNGKAFVISSMEVVIGKASGIGQMDPALADQHLSLIWQNNVLQYRMLGGQIRIDGVIPAQYGVLQLGQSFQMGSSIWQVNTQAGTLGGLLDSLGSRLNSLASTEKLEGFSLKAMFSEVFKKRKQEAVDEYFICGTSKTTPPIQDAVTGWPKPWFFMRVLMFMAGVFAVFWIGWREFTNMNLLPGMMMIGSMVVPLATVILFFELNTPRNVSFHYALVVLCAGGVVSLFVALIGFSVSGLSSVLGPPAAGIVEETGKLITVIVIVRNTRYKYTLNGLLFGAAVGAGFAIFESAGYAFNAFERAFVNNLGRAEVGAVMQYAGTQLTDSIILRGLLSPFCHVAWTAISAGALWRVKWDRPFSVGMLGNPMFWKAFLIPVCLHMIWNSPIPTLFFIPMLLNGTVSWFIVFGLVQQGLKQVKREQLMQTKEELSRTQSIVAAVTSSHRAPVLR